MIKYIRGYKEYRRLRADVIDNLELARDYEEQRVPDRARILYIMSKRLVGDWLLKNPTNIRRANTLLKLIERTKKQCQRDKDSTRILM